MPTEVKEYRCDYCGQEGFRSKKSAMAHEENCLKNPGVIAAGWEECYACQGTGNHYGKQRPGVIGYATCRSCGGSGRRKKIKIPQEVIEELKNIDKHFPPPTCATIKKGGVKIK